MTNGCSGMVRRMASLAAGALAVAAGGCLHQQPAAPQSAAQVTDQRRAGELEFFDELERRPMACQDDLLHGLLLVAGGELPATAQARAETARRAGIVDAGYRRDPLDRVTVHEAAVAAARVVGGPGSRDHAAWTDGATDWARRAGLVPAEARPDDALTGAQLLAILGGVSDIRAARPPQSSVVPGAPAAASGAGAKDIPAAPDDDFDKFTAIPAPKPAPAPAPPAETPVPDQSARASRPTAGGLPKARTEPVPEMRPVAPSTVDAASDKGADVSPPPPPPVTAAATPAPAPAAVVVPKPKANPWASGRPITSGK